MRTNMTPTFDTSDVASACSCSPVRPARAVDQLLADELDVTRFDLADRDGMTAVARVDVERRVSVRT
jgi:hypothetical protein